MTKQDVLNSFNPMLKHFFNIDLSEYKNIKNIVFDHEKEGLHIYYDKGVETFEKLNIKITDFYIGQCVYLMHDNKIVSADVMEIIHLKDNKYNLKVQIRRRGWNIIPEIISSDKVFVTKDDLIDSLSIDDLI